MAAQEWRAKLTCIQESLHPGSRLLKPLATALRHFGFAAHRWESSACGRRRFCLLLAPVMVMLAAKAADPRSQPAEKQRCLNHLRRITPEFVLTAGLSSDFNAEVLQFLRKFDAEDMDPARMRWAAQVFAQRLNSLFGEASVLKEVAGETLECQTSTVLAVRIAREMPPVYVDSFCFNPWPDTSLRLRAPAVLRSMQTVVTLMRCQHFGLVQSADLRDCQGLSCRLSRCANCHSNNSNHM